MLALRLAVFTLAVMLFFGVSQAQEEGEQSPTRFPPGAIYPIIRLDSWNDPKDCAALADTTAEAGTFPDVSSVEIQQMDAGFQVLVHLLPWQPQASDYGINQFGASVSTDGVNVVNYVLTTQNGVRADGGQVGADNQFVAGTEETLNLSDDGRIFTLTLADQPQQLAVLAGTTTKCDEFPNDFTFGDPNTYLTVPPLLSPEEVDALIARSAEVEQMALSPQDTGESADTIRDRSYVIEDILQCMTFGGEITRESLAGFVSVHVGNHPTNGKFFTVQIDPLVREALDDAGVSARLLVHTYDDAEAQTGAFIVEYGFGEFRGGPTEDGVTFTVNEYATSLGYRDGFVQVAIEATTVEAVLSSPNAPSSTFTDDQSNCPGTAEVM